MMHPKARIDVNKIPEIIQKYRGNLKFAAEDIPYFTYVPKRALKNTGEILSTLKEIVEALCS